MEIAMSLHDQVMQESALRRARQALTVAMDTPEKFGGPPEDPKKPKKPKRSLAARLKSGVQQAASAMFPRTEGVDLSRTSLVIDETDRRPSMADILGRAKRVKPQQIARRLPGAPPPKPPGGGTWKDPAQAARHERERFTPEQHRAAMHAWKKREASNPDPLGSVAPSRFGSPRDPGGLRRGGSVRKG